MSGDFESVNNKHIFLILRKALKLEANMEEAIKIILKLYLLLYFLGLLGTLYKEFNLILNKFYVSG